MNRDDADRLSTRRTLLSKVRRGDELGWQRFYHLYENFIYDAARSAGLTHEEGMDVVQETMVTVQNYIASFTPDASRGKFRTWLRKIVRCRIADRYRVKKRSALDRAGMKPRTEEATTSATNCIPDESQIDLSRLIDDKLEQALLEEAQNKAKAQVRMEDYQAYDLFSVKELTAKQAAASLGILPATVRVRAFRVRQVVERELKKFSRMLERPDLPV